ncbi:MAG: hypothetical protein PHG63_03305 [Candidatus Dojkabacteria bacterium]|jgi:hypothetical protein|nr:hypothetical protein [Candidatus Dojkabacteria bacterium]
MVDIIDLLTVKNALRLVLFVFMFGYVVFSLLFGFRIRILADTLRTKASRLVSMLAQIHFVAVLIVCVVVSLLVLF